MGGRRAKGKAVPKQRPVEPAEDGGCGTQGLQPMDGPDVADHTTAAVDYCLRHPQWRLSLQTHKTLGIR